MPTELDQVPYAPPGLVEEIAGQAKDAGFMAAFRTGKTAPTAATFAEALDSVPSPSEQAKRAMSDEFDHLAVTPTAVDIEPGRGGIMVTIHHNTPPDALEMFRNDIRRRSKGWRRHVRRQKALHPGR